jgi:hypothetical protein
MESISLYLLDWGGKIKGGWIRLQGNPSSFFHSCGGFRQVVPPPVRIPATSPQAEAFVSKATTKILNLKPKTLNFKPRPKAPSNFLQYLPVDK